MNEALQLSPKFRRWKNDLLAQGLSIESIEEIYTRYRHNGDALFSLVLLHATTPEGTTIPPICFLKGQVVSVLVVLIAEETGEKFVLLVKQRRICNGGLIYEPVAGMVDGEDIPLEVAVKEVEEETGVKVEAKDVHLLHDEPYFVSTGTSDESIYLYFTEIYLPLTRIQSYHNRKTGLDHEHEFIWTHVATIPEARKLITNTNGLLNLCLYLEKSSPAA